MKILNVMTVDVEEHFQVSAFEDVVDRDQWDTLPSRVEDNTSRLLDLFDETEVRATFFVLGWIAERHPALVRRIADRGHEIASHGYGHRLVYDQTPDEFRRETVLSRSILQDASGQPVDGYRAASFSVMKQSLWALDVLVEAGFAYDSSIFPVLHDRYGIPGAPRELHRARTPQGRTIVEFPSVDDEAGSGDPSGGRGRLPEDLPEFGDPLGHRSPQPARGDAGRGLHPSLGNRSRAAADRGQAAQSLPSLLGVEENDVQVAGYHETIRLRADEAGHPTHGRLPAGVPGTGAPCYLRRPMSDSASVIDGPPAGGETSDLEVVRLSAGDQDAKAWDSFVEASPSGTIFHQTAWMRVVEDAFRHKPRYLFAAAAGEIRGVLPLFEVRGWLSGRVFTSVPYAVYGGLCASDPAARRLLLEDARRMAEQEGMRHVELRHIHEPEAGLPTKELYSYFERALDPRSGREPQGRASQAAAHDPAGDQERAGTPARLGIARRLVRGLRREPQASRLTALPSTAVRGHA